MVASGQVRDYRVELPAGSAVEVSLQRRDNFVRLIRDSETPAALPFLTEAGRASVVHLSLVADDQRVWRLSVSAYRADQSASYRLQLDAAHPATPADRQRAAAQTAFAHAEILRRDAGSFESGSAHVDPALAENAYAEAIAAWTAANDTCGLLIAHTARARFAFAQAHYADAAAAARQALAQHCQATQGDDGARALAADLAAAERMLGSTLGYLGDFEGSAHWNERALDHYRQTGDVRFQGVELANLSQVYRQTGETAKALQAAEGALLIAHDSGDDKGMAFSREAVASIHLARGELSAALDAALRTIDYLKRAPYPLAEGMVRNDLGLIYQQLGDVDAAADSYSKAATIWRASGDVSLQIETALDQGELMLAAGRSDAARAAYAEALSLAETHDFASHRLHALLGLGNCAIALHENEEAQRLLDQALQLASTSLEKPVLGETWRSLGDLALRNGQLRLARKHYRQFRDIAVATADHGAQALALASLARSELQLGLLPRASSDIQAALGLIGDQRIRIDPPALRSHYFATHRDYYTLAIQVLLALDSEHPRHGYAEQAFITAELARARALQDFLAERDLDPSEQLDPSVATTLHEALERVRTLVWREQRTTTEASRAALRADIDEASRALDAARGHARAANPRYAELTNPEPLALHELQTRLLDADTALLEFWLGQARSELWVVTRERVSHYALPPRAQIEGLVMSLRAGLTSAPQKAGETIEQLAERQGTAQIDNDEIMRTLSASLKLANLAALPQRKLAIVADGELQRLPFALLSAGDTRLVDTHELVYLPSAQTLRWLRRGRAATVPDSMAIFADPVFRADDPRLHSVAPTRASSEARGFAELPRLPASLAEAQAIAALAPKTPPQLAVGFDASRDTALHLHWQDYAIVHFATHALIDLQRPELSGIVLSLYDQQGLERDGFLRINDIYDLDMPADLVVLSACDSANGLSTEGEGVFSLARAFFYAGSRRVLATLWPVDDRAAAEFMRAFYGALLRDHAPPAAAVQRAQQRLAADPRWSAPMYWAGYVLQGDWR